MRWRPLIRSRLARYGFTERQAAAVALILPAGAGAVLSALLERFSVAIALIGALVTVAALAAVQARRRTAADRRTIRDLQVVVEETQRRLMVIAEQERDAAADRHRTLLDAVQQAYPVATNGIATSLRDV